MSILLSSLFAAGVFGFAAASPSRPDPADGLRVATPQGTTASVNPSAEGSPFTKVGFAQTGVLDGTEDLETYVPPEAESEPDTDAGTDAALTGSVLAVLGMSNLAFEPGEPSAPAVDDLAGTVNAEFAVAGTRIEVIGENGETVIVNTEGADEQPQARSVNIRVVGDGQAFTISDVSGTEARKVPFIGVVTSPLGEQVRAQTALPEDVGLTVDVVSPGSPAEKAGLKPYDILAKYDDQILCAAVQLSALVKRTGTGKTATLTVLRGGKEMPLEVTVGEHAAEATINVEGFPLGAAHPMLLPRMATTAAIDANAAKQLAKLNALDANAAKELEQRGLALEQQARVLERNGLAWAQAATRAGTSLLPPVPPVPPAPVAAAYAGTLSAPGAQVQKGTRYLFVTPPAASQNQSVAIVSDDEGRVEIREVNGERTVTISDKAGAPQYSGPLNSPEDREKIPENLRERVQKAEASTAPKGAAIPPALPGMPCVEAEQTERGVTT